MSTGYHYPNLRFAYRVSEISGPSHFAEQANLDDTSEHFNLCHDLKSGESVGPDFTLQVLDLPQKDQSCVPSQMVHQ
jgi:hypothetical protein